jgi:hypothetical protein
MSLWYTFRADDPKKVVEHLELKQTRPCRFAERVTSLVGPEETMFVTPAVKGWVLAFGEWPSSATAMAAGRVQVWVEIASVAFGDAQAFASDDRRDRRAWLRARKGDLTRGLVFDRGSYPLALGKLTPKEPRFPRPGATPSDDDVRKMARAWSVDPRDIEFRKPGILGTRDTTFRLPKKEGESDKEFFGRTGYVYLQHRWDDDAYDGPSMRMELPGFSFCWPRAWKKPATARRHAAVVAARGQSDVPGVAKREPLAGLGQLLDSNARTDAGANEPELAGDGRQEDSSRRRRGNGDGGDLDGVSAGGASAAFLVRAALDVRPITDVSRRDSAGARARAGVAVL